MHNRLIRAATRDGSIRAAACIATELVETARRCHETSPTATAALGRALIGTMFLGLNLKGEDTLTVRIFGDGPLGGIITQADANYSVRGYVQEPHVHLPPTSQGKLDVGRAVGKDGFIYVTKDLGLKEPYTGSSPLVSGEIAEDFAYFLHQSEQTPAVVALGVLIDRDHTCIAAGGYFIQAFPGAQEDTLAQLEKNIGEVPPVTNLIADGFQEVEILQKVFGNIPFEVLAEEDWRFLCRCGKERLEKILISLGPEELKDMLEKEQGAELRCHFCNKQYHFSREEIEALLEEIRSY
ncbi:Hsp33 family molecular chaperone HslO [Thermanaerosceptrum fracticalcis]|uniref:33 kDa chaperonin n=1 Tax=Thermanaerosceptrum fracticalcis TaxID=1712410 RepID=A0A7G6E1M9_THEFR|nr:Hsp33 family molecular chaperone HslO [Thermanaerosceptrum fracticalcis]QNB45983.1 Hsp33 family molecular chaperone HslO [Thermanaerosceptrum fracticalcis]